MSLRIDVAHYDCYSQLWLSVMHRAVEDASVVLPEPRAHMHTYDCRKGCDKRLYSEDHLSQRSAREWFMSGSDDVCSFEWLCSILNLESEAVRRELRKRIEANLANARFGSSGVAGEDTGSLLDEGEETGGRHDG